MVKINKCVWRLRGATEVGSVREAGDGGKRCGGEGVEAERVSGRGRGVYLPRSE